MRILLTGVHGQLGTDLLPLLQQQGDVIAVGRSECDLTSVDAIRKLVAEIQPSVIVNPAAYTAVNEAEAQPALAYAINGTAAGALAEEARKLDAMFIHYSTDYVFDGCKREPYTEIDTVAPLNVYGASKLAGERAVVAAGGRFLVLRTSWVYGANGNNFLLTIRRLAREREELKIVGHGEAGATIRCNGRLCFSGGSLPYDCGRERLLVWICSCHHRGVQRTRGFQTAADSRRPIQRISDASAPSAEFGIEQRQV
jgi:dTDP-4-dehydrorhamnose reductase